MTFHPEPARPGTPPAYGPQTAQAVLDIIKAQPALHDQDVWEDATPCGTVRCVAGWAQWIHEGLVVTPLDDGQDVEAAGRRYLDLNILDADKLFRRVGNDMAVLALEEIAASRPLDWPQLRRRAWDEGPLP